MAGVINNSRAIVRCAPSHLHQSSLYQPPAYAFRITEYVAGLFNYKGHILRQYEIKAVAVGSMLPLAIGDLPRFQLLCFLVGRKINLSASSAQEELSQC